ncbi:MAG: nucleotidyltransferase [Ignavibacteriaceae bacterium]
MDILTKFNKELDSFCKANNIKKLSLFGSYLKDTANSESDVDLLVEFAENVEYGLLDIARMERQLSEIIGRKVDLRTPEELSRYFRDSVIKEARIKYEA